MSGQTYRVSVEINANNVEATLKKLNELFDRLDDNSNNAGKSIDKFGNELSKAKKNASQTKKELEGLERTAGNLKSAFAAAQVAIGALGIGAGLSAIVEAQREFDVLNSQLITATGGMEQAGLAFNELQKFASQTPYGLAQSVEGFVKLKNLGLDPSIESMTSFGNTASAMGKDLSQMIEAVADASTGEFERLKEFGIKARKQGSNIEFTFQGVTTKVKNNAKDIQKYLFDIGNVNFAGAMDERAKTLDGQLSALGDSWQMFKLSLSKGGIGDIVAKGVAIASENLDKLTIYLSDPSTVAMFENAIKKLGDAFYLLKDGLAGIKDFLTPLGEFFANNKELSIALASGLGTAAAAFVVLSGAAALVSAAVAIIASPVLAATVAFAALVAAGVYLYRNWDELKAKAQEVWNGVKQYVSDAWEGIKSSVTTKVEAVKNTAINKFNEIKGRIAAIVGSFPEPVRNAINAVYMVFSTQFNVIKTLVSTSFNFVKNIFITAFNVIKALVRGDMTAVRQAFKDGFDRAVQIAKKTKDDIISALKDLGTRLLQMGRDAVQGLINGMSEKITAAVNKAQEIAGKVIGAVKGAFDIHSPSRVMKSLGEWVSEGLALGIDHKAAMVEKSAKKLAKTTKDALTSELQRLRRELFVGKLKLQHNPFAELTADIAFGKYGKHDTAQLLLLAEQNDRMQKAVEFSERLQKVRQEIAEIGLDEIGLLELQRSNYAMINDENFNRLKTLTEQKNAKQNTHNLTQKIKELDEKILLVGKSELEVLQHQLNTAKEYEGVSDDIKQSYLDRTKALQEAVKATERLAKVESATEDIAKHKHILANWQDKHAALVYDLTKDGYDASQIEKIVGAEKVKEQVAELTKLFDDLKNKKVFGDAINTANITSFGGGIDFVTQLYQKQAELDKVLKNERAKLKNSHEQGLLDLKTYQQQDLALREQYEAKKRQLSESSNQALFGGATSLMKMMYGENHKYHKWAFALEKTYAVSRILLQNKVALANAWASAPFPANLGAVAKTLAQTGALASAVNAIKPIGQAHDGIMSVPKSGTWNLEKGERVLPKHTAKALDNKLASMGNGKAVNVIIHNHSNAQATVEEQPNGDIMVTIGKMISDTVDAKVNQRFIQARRQGGELYGR
ncbi:hypothetical protein AAX06_01485 [Moraxella bovoculi]|uniref:Tape measure protein N-terminal domain-containing protein n=1 Tax=Moraxella bovoculi TaxID=386891 RepID=A0AAC8T7Q1_9GAMM|nr:tape measure protein [Moraxella bovoculi]AKG07068.1 hypothetical protein AAX06_01485 [Moraxella bovoculi]